MNLKCQVNGRPDRVPVMTRVFPSVPVGVVSVKVVRGARRSDDRWDNTRGGGASTLGFRLYTVSKV